MTVLEETQPEMRNESMTETLRLIAVRQQGRRINSGEDTQQMLREARSGRM
jgi:hypothetical protein